MNEKIDFVWHEAANRCAICKAELAKNETENSTTNASGVILEYNTHLEVTEDISSDEPDMVLLCQSDYDYVRRNSDTFDRDILDILKRKHELWVYNFLYSKKEQGINGIYFDEIVSVDRLLSLLDQAEGYFLDSNLQRSSINNVVCRKLFKAINEYETTDKEIALEKRENVLNAFNILVKKRVRVFGKVVLQDVYQKASSDYRTLSICFIVVLNKNTSLNHFNGKKLIYHIPSGLAF